MLAGTQPHRTLAARLAGIAVAGITMLAFCPPMALAGEPTCFGRVATILGDEGRERIEGTPGSDVSIGLGGRDIIFRRRRRRLRLWERWERRDRRRPRKRQHDGRSRP